MHLVICASTFVWRLPCKRFPTYIKPENENGIQVFVHYPYLEDLLFILSIPGILVIPGTL